MAASKPALNGAAESWAGAANWKDLDESVVDPITLEPIADLAVALFRLKGFLFDAEALEPQHEVTESARTHSDDSSI